MLHGRRRLTMPGRKQIDTSQSSADRNILRRSTVGVIKSTQAEDTVGFAKKSGSLGQFSATTSAELADIMANETGSGQLVFNTDPLLLQPKIGNNHSVILTKDAVTGSTANKILMQFPMYDVEHPLPVYGTADILIQVDVGKLTGTSVVSQSIIQKRVTKILAIFDNDTNFEDDPFPAIEGQDREVYFVEYATVNTSGYNSIGTIGTFNIIQNTANMTFDLVVTPATNNYMKYRVIATCVLSSDHDFLIPVTATPAE